MSPRRGNIENKCPECRISMLYCYCKYINICENKTPLKIIMHHRERFLTTNTATLAKRCLTDCEIQLRGMKDQSVDMNALLPDGYTHLFLYPDEDAIELSKEFIESLEKPPCLIVPDGTWSQAKKIKTREGLGHIQSVTIPFSGTSEYKLRKAHQPEYLCTFEAIANAYKILEGEKIYSSLMSSFRAMVDHISRGREGRPINVSK